MKKKILFLTGTRADFGKLKSLISISQKSEDFEVHIFATGMHMNSKYGKTVDEIFKAGFANIYQYINHDAIENMDRTLAKTVDGFSHYISEIKPDLIVVHGDRVEALAGAIVGSLNNTLVAHIEGGEISGTIDELIRHAVTKMSHIHFVANESAKKRLIQLGEREDSIFVIGSPDLDLMNPSTLPRLDVVKGHYNIDFNSYAISMFHPVTTEYSSIREHASSFVQALIDSDKNYVLIYPNNDLGSIEILDEYKKLEGNSRFKVYPSLRFEYFLTLLKGADFIIGNSSAGVREAPYYDVPTIDVGSRQNNRVSLDSIIHCNYDVDEILNSIQEASVLDVKEDAGQHCFGQGKSDVLFMGLLCSDELWSISHQKQFQEI
ncbi:UDP-N-acetylglucosamine 2-epimerase [Aestuariirhabdus sp. Z084]|uniref:UDP-N-acetylglucosamine 2-epimerase n=1 Tax=Aestuariirhabdus haliotis TaxID=2918751 RepID=UPI00201B3E69|nr:UDP-N-acetylglucosamine 2-epimerase [Aestuariirhabdus haliotis]MCL6415597.1 UDP-N-acetylglucosamine 2-epimerase [Aestuariirhabdus haliotis]MCL6419592.1 UDP-N-acetylglucosamine 2-epimerase [Aestuariirhabdus haliotis]